MEQEKEYHSLCQLIDKYKSNKKDINDKINNEFCRLNATPSINPHSSINVKQFISNENSKFIESSTTSGGYRTFYLVKINIYPDIIFEIEFNCFNNDTYLPTILEFTEDEIKDRYQTEFY